MIEKYSQDFCNLAEQLAQNHIRLSFPPDLWTVARSQILKNSRPTSTRAVIVVTGAGVSTNASGLPLGSETATLLRERLQVPQDFLDRELNRLSVQYRLERKDFETQLLALSKFNENRLLDQLGSIFVRRFYPSMVYEILAHLLTQK